MSLKATLAVEFEMEYKVQYFHLSGLDVLSGTNSNTLSQNCISVHVHVLTSPHDTLQ